MACAVVGELLLDGDQRDSTVLYTRDGRLHAAAFRQCPRERLLMRLSTHSRSIHCYTRLWRSSTCLTSGAMSPQCHRLLNAAPTSEEDRPTQATRHPGVQSYTDASSRLTQTAITVLRERMRRNRERGETRNASWPRRTTTSIQVYISSW